jgi:ATP-dependent DNA helicase RecQ
VLRERFGFNPFRPGQRELVETALAGRDALGILPTGGGKSLTYQLPATLLDGLTVVVSPLIALMKDQVDAFNRRGLGLAVAIHSNLTPGDARAALDQARSGTARLLYLAPERLELPEWRGRLREAAPRLLVIDEAHCVSQWGYDFRPAYLALREVAEQLRPCAVLALTATATAAVRQDVVRQLGLRDPFVFVAPFDRPNLGLEVIPCEPREKIARLTEILRSGAGGGSHIVYVGRRRDAEEIAEDLDAMGLRAVAYHAGLAPEERHHAQEAWLSGRRPIVVATLAFGMGIDKPDVRTVVHWQHPSSLEAYYQEAGRAGRDGHPARCVILFSERDVDLQVYFLAQRYPTRDDVKRLLSEIPEGRVRSEDLGSAGAWLTDEQRNVAVLALIDEAVLVRGADGGLRRVDKAAARRRLSLAGMKARRDADHARLRAIVAYCRDRRCQRRHLLAYFGEALADDFRCGNCSACGRRRPPRFVEAAGRGAIECLTSSRPAGDPACRALEVGRDVSTRLALDGPLTARRLGQFLRGRRTSRMPAAWRDLPGFGLCSGLGRDEAERLAEDVLGRLGPTPVPAPVPHPAPPPEAATAFWSGASHAFTRDELVGRPVPRPVGLGILKLVAAADGVLAPSGVANVLRGSRGCDAVREHPPLTQSPLFGSVKDRSYEDLVADALAMYAKGFLAVVAGSKRFALAESGRRILGGERATAHPSSPR